MVLALSAIAILLVKVPRMQRRSGAFAAETARLLAVDHSGTRRQLITCAMVNRLCGLAVQRKRYVRSGRGKRRDLGQRAAHAPQLSPHCATPQTSISLNANILHIHLDLRRLVGRLGAAKRFRIFTKQGKLNQAPRSKRGIAQAQHWWLQSYRLAEGGLIVREGGDRQKQAMRQC